MDVVSGGYDVLLCPAPSPVLFFSVSRLDYGVSVGLDGHCPIDHRFEVLVRNVGDTRPSHGATGEDIAHVGIPRFLETVRGHQDGPGKIGELPGLILPGCSVMTVQMGVLF